VILATDEDREGEAIAFHLAHVLNLKDPKRIVFHEITKTAIKKALENPRDINMNLVDAQQARRILDRLVGYKLSPFLWKKIAKGLSAGRVQSIAVKLIVERQKEIDKFKPQEYWSIEAEFEKENKNFIAKLFKKENKKISKLEIENEKQAKDIVKDLKGAEYEIENILKREIKKHPPTPLTTSTMQQVAGNRLGFSAKQTMFLAQKLYETGLITYHRTDSLNLSKQFLSAAAKLIKDQFGENYYIGQARRFKTKEKGAQEAHEAIRPTNPEKTPEEIKNKLSKKHLKLYKLIWQRAIASQMQSAIIDSTSVDIKTISLNSYIFRATGAIIKFDGFLRAYPTKVTENILPVLNKQEKLNLIKLISDQHFTKPPALYSEAMLIKTLKEYGIGRPSTYAPILSTIQARNYVKKEKRYLHPTEIGKTVNNMLVEHFPTIVDVEFSAKMEKDLDKIAQGKEQWVSIIKTFYTPFAENLEQKYEQVKKLIKVTEKKCPKCGNLLVERMSRYGKFLGCSNFPKCKYIESLEKKQNHDNSKKASKQDKEK